MDEVDMQYDSCWVDQLWSQVRETTEGSFEKKSEEEKELFKLRRRGAIPLAYFGHHFQDEYNEFKIKVFPVSFPEMFAENSLFRSFATTVASLHFSISEQEGSVQMYTSRENIKSLMMKILSSKMQAPFLTIELEQRQVDTKVKNDEGSLYFFPTLISKAVLQVDTGNLSSIPKSVLVDSSVSEKQRAIFIANLPLSVESTFLKILFPNILKCRSIQLKEQMRSAVMVTKSKAVAVGIKSSIAGLTINGQSALLCTANANTKDDGEKVIDDPNPFISAMQPQIKKLRLAEQKARKKSPADLRRSSKWWDKRREQEEAAQAGNIFRDVPITAKPPPAVPELGAPIPQLAESRPEATQYPMHPPPFPGEEEVAMGYSRPAGLVPPPYPESWHRADAAILTAQHGYDEKATIEYHKFMRENGPMGPKGGKWRAPGKIERDNKRFEEYLKKKGLTPNKQKLVSPDSAAKQASAQVSPHVWIADSQQEMQQKQKVEFHKTLRLTGPAGPNGGKFRTPRDIERDRKRMDKFNEKINIKKISETNAPASSSQANDPTNADAHNRFTNPNRFNWVRAGEAPSPASAAPRHQHSHSAPATVDNLYDPAYPSSEERVPSSRLPVKDVRLDREYLLSLADMALQDFYAFRNAGDEDRAEAAWRKHCQARSDAANVALAPIEAWRDAMY